MSAALAVLNIYQSTRHLLETARLMQQAGSYHHAAMLLHRLAGEKISSGEVAEAVPANKLAIDFVIRSAHDKEPLPEGAPMHHETLDEMLELRRQIHLALEKQPSPS